MPARHGGGVGKGSDDNKPQWIQDNQQKHRADAVQNGVEHHVPPLAANPVTGMRHGLIPPYHRLVSPSFLVTPLTSTSSTKLITLLNRFTAVDTAYWLFFRPILYT